MARAELPRLKTPKVDIDPCADETTIFSAAIGNVILKLRQGVGRLIRTKSDSGIVVILDNRIVTGPYGRAFLKALSDCPVKVI